MGPGSEGGNKGTSRVTNKGTSKRRPVRGPGVPIQRACHQGRAVSVWIRRTMSRNKGC